MTQASIPMTETVMPLCQNGGMPEAEAVAPSGPAPFRTFGPSLTSRTSAPLQGPAFSAMNSGRLQTLIEQAEAAAALGDHAGARKSAGALLQFVQSRLGSEIALDTGAALAEEILGGFLVEVTSPAELTQIATGFGRDFLAVQIAAPRRAALTFPDAAVDRSAQTAHAIAAIKECRLPAPVEASLVDNVMALESAVGLQDVAAFVSAAVAYNSTVASLSEVAISPLVASTLIGVVGRIYPGIVWIIIVVVAFLVIVGGFYYGFSEAPSAGAFRKITRFIEKGKNPSAQDVRDTVKDSLKGLTPDQIKEVKEQVRKRVNDVTGKDVELYNDYVTALGELRKQSD